jgi:hypothetical protein
MKKVIIAGILMLSFICSNANEDLPTLYQGAFPALCGDSEEIKKVAKIKNDYL